MDARAQMLGQLASNLPAEIRIAKGQLVNILELFYDFNGQVVDKQNGISDVKEDLTDYITKYRELTAAQHDQLETLIKKLEDKAAEVHKKVDEAQQKLIEAFVEIQDDFMKAILAQINGAKEKKEEVPNIWRPRFIAFQQKAISSQEALESNFANIKEVVGALSEHVSQSDQLTQLKLSAISEHMEEVHQQAQGKAVEMKSLLEAMQQEFSQRLEDARAGQVSPAFGKILEEFQEKVFGEVRPALEEHTNGVGSVLEQLADDLTSSKERSSSSRRALEPQLNSFQGILSPLGSAVDAAKETVAKVGLTLG